MNDRPPWIHLAELPPFFRKRTRILSEGHLFVSNTNARMAQNVTIVATDYDCIMGPINY